MNVIKVTPRGYCKGVVKAIEIAKKAAIDYPKEDIYILGMLVHNKYVMLALKALNIKFLDSNSKTRFDLLDDISSGVVIFTAHGVHKSVIDKAKSKGLICIDASCSDVKKTQQIVDEYLAKDFKVIYIGKSKHPESEAVCYNNSNCYLVENANDINELPTLNKVFVTNQTTMSYKDIEELFKLILVKYPDAIISEEICNATRIRQEAIYNLKDQEIDLLVVVGDKKSNNSNRLAKIGIDTGIKNTILIDDVRDLINYNFNDIKNVAITSGASTPTYLTNQVISYLEAYPVNLPTIDLSKII